MQPGTYRMRPIGGGGDTPAVYALLSIMGIIFFIDFFYGGRLDPILAWPPSVPWFGTLMLWQPLTFPFVHLGNFIFLLTDAIVLYFFGGSLERAWGSWKFLFFFFASGIVPGLVVMALSPWLPVSPYFVGMVGSFMAMVVAFAAMNPYETVLLIIFPMQARWLGVLSVAFELFGRSGRYGGPYPALVAIAVTVVFAYFFTTSRLSWNSLLPRGGPTMRERIERWQQRRRMREWQRRVSRVDRPEDLFKDKK
jgi:membrane associated rhomboid family serine protease